MDKVFAAYLLKGLKKVKSIETEVKIMVASDLTLADVTRRLKMLDLDEAESGYREKLDPDMTALSATGQVRVRGSVTGNQRCYICEEDHMMKVCPCIKCPKCGKFGHLPHNCSEKHKEGQKVQNAAKGRNVANVALCVVTKGHYVYSVNDKPVIFERNVGSDDDEDCEPLIIDESWTNAERVSPRKLG